MSSPSDFFGAGRSINTNHPSTTNLHPLYLTQPSIFLDPSRQTLIGKRTLAEFQTQNLNNINTINNPSNLNNNNYLLRSVRPRNFQHPMDFSEFSTPSAFPPHRYPMSQLHPPRPNLTPPQQITNSFLLNPNFQNRVTLTTGPEKKSMNHRLQELEKQLLEDNDDDNGDAVSVITDSEWSETIQNLITQKQPVSSPVSSTTSSNSSSSSVASIASTTCSKQSLMEASTAIYEGKFDTAAEILTRLSQGLNPNGNSDQRFTNCMVSALRSRMNQVEYPPPVLELFSDEHAESTQLLFEHSLCFKVAFMAANLAILDAAFEGVTENDIVKFCVVDFNIGHGKQYASLLHEFSSKLKGKPATIKIIAVADNGVEERLKTLDDMLSRHAERLGIGFEFKVVNRKLAELTRESLGCDPDEPLAVNFAFKLYRLPDESVSTENPRDELLRRVKALAPRVVTLVEQEMNANTALFAARVGEMCSYYGAVFDSVESTMARDNAERVRIEEGLSRRVGNSVACEGRDRVERCEVFGKWRARMSMAGFALKPVSQKVAESIKTRLGPGKRVTVKEENGGVCFGWMGRTLTVASAWR
ncbi:hypothetical protein RJT34_24978 [Clitoria ternatea]|uniref:Scarecrow-like protein 8 n=1 Tax=Clitoria ternatea TaxID=43366 RepID=A0AAN9FNW9_CLITE